MNSEAYYCPQCKQYIFDTFCFKCNKNISEMKDDSLDIFKDLFGEENPFNEK